MSDEVECVKVVKSPARIFGRKRNITDMLMDKGVRVQTDGPFNDVLGMTLTNFFQMVITHNIDMNNKNCFGLKTKKQAKAKAKSVWGRACMLMTQEEKDIIDRLRGNRPAPDSLDRTVWMKELVDVCSGLNEKFMIDIKRIIVEYNECFKKQYKKRPATTVSVAATLVDFHWATRTQIEKEEADDLMAAKVAEAKTQQESDVAADDEYMTMTTIDDEDGVV